MPLPVSTENLYVTEKRISQTENKELKQKLKQIRNDCEMSQEKLYQIAREKSYYVPAAKATDQEISHVKNILAGISTH